MRWLSVPLVLAGVAVGAWNAKAAPEDPYVGSDAQRLAEEAGWRQVSRLRADITGDGRTDEILVQRAAQQGRLRLVILSPSAVDAERGRKFEKVYAEDLPDAREVVRLETMPVAGAEAPDLVAVFETPSPDERLVTVRIIGAATGAGIKAFWKKAFINAAAPAPVTRRFGDAVPHFELADTDGDGTMEIRWILGPATLSVKGEEGPARFVIGARQRTLRFDAQAGAYVEPSVDTPEETVDFLPPRRPTRVEATRQVPKIWGTAQAFWGADGDLETAWTVARRQAVGQALTVRFARSPTVSMIRVVPGCGGSRADWNRYRAVERFRIQLSSGLRFDLRADGRGPWPSGVAGLGVFPLDGGFGRQILIFLKTPARLAWGRFEIRGYGRAKKVSARHRTDEVCISEVSFH